MFQRGDRVISVMGAQTFTEKVRGTVTACFESEIDELTDRVHVSWDDGRRRVIRGNVLRKLDIVEMLSDLAT